jgi:hypothetical protein
MMLVSGKSNQQRWEAFSKTLVAPSLVEALENKLREDEGLLLDHQDDSLAVHLNIPFDRKIAKRVISHVPSLKGYPCVWKYKWLVPHPSPSRIEDLSATQVKAAALAQTVVVLRPRIPSNDVKIRNSTWAQRGWPCKSAF